jgi:hypothetical protein
MERDTNENQEAPTESEVASDKPGPSGLAEDLGKVWDEVTGGADHAPSDEFAETYAPFKDALDREGLSPIEYTRRMIAFSAAVDRNPDLLWELSEYHSGDRSGPHPAIRIHQQWELNGFLQKHPDAAQLTQKMGEHLQREPEKKGESIRAALTRAYKAVSQTKAQPKTTKAAKQRRHLADDISDVWDQVMGKR